jgi:hypothetical protein
MYQKKSLDSRIINLSNKGLMLELAAPVKLGDAVKVQFSPDSQERVDFGKDYCIGRVRWCAPQTGISSGLYGVGIELVQDSPLRYAQMN